jgi:hypothetical protein
MEKSFPPFSVLMNPEFGLLSKHRAVLEGHSSERDGAEMVAITP